MEQCLHLRLRSKMATCSVVLNDVLCFVRNRYVKTSVKQLKTALTDFYDVEALAAAKNDLLRDTEHLRNLMKFPHVPQRRDGDNRLVRETDDILSIFHCLDEQKMLDKLPRYVSDGPDNMPSTRLYEGDLNTVMRILDSLKDKMAEQSAVLLNVSRDIHDIQVRYASQSSTGHVAPGTVDHAGAQSGPGSVSISGGATGGFSNRWETVSAGQDRSVQQLQGGVSREPSVSVSTPSSASARNNRNNDVDSEQPGNWTQVASSKRKKRRIQTSGQEVGATDTADANNANNDENRQKRNKSRNLDSRSNRVMVGTKKLDWPVVGTVDQSKIAAAKPYLRKSVFCIDNVSTDVTVKDLETFVADSLNVNVISCFQVKPRRAKWQKEAGIVPTDRKTFRLCIDREDEQSFLNEEIWPQKIAIYRWAFKNRNQDSNQNRSGDKEATVIASRSSRPASDGNFHPSCQSTPSTNRFAALSSTSSGDAAAAAAADDVSDDVSDDVIPSATRWADAVDMDATDTDATVIMNTNDYAAL